MHPREEAKRDLVRQWVAKAEKDPGDFPEVATEAVISAVGLAAKVRRAVLALLGPDLTQRCGED